MNLWISRKAKTKVRWIKQQQLNSIDREVVSNGRVFWARFRDPDQKHWASAIGMFSWVRASCDDVIVLTKREPKFVIGYTWFQDGGL